MLTNKNKSSITTFLPTAWSGKICRYGRRTGLRIVKQGHSRTVKAKRSRTMSQRLEGSIVDNDSVRAFGEVEANTLQVGRSQRMMSFASIMEKVADERMRCSVTGTVWSRQTAEVMTWT